MARRLRGHSRANRGEFFPGGVLLVPVRAFRASFVFGNDDYAWFPDVGGYPVGKIPRRAVLSAAGAFVFIARYGFIFFSHLPVLVTVVTVTKSTTYSCYPTSCRFEPATFTWHVILD